MTAIRLALLEFRRFRGHPIRYAALAVIVLMPLLYAGLYLWSSWDPYGRMDRVPVAVVNEDAGATMDGKRLRAGDELVDQLKQTSYLDWNFVSGTEAERGMNEGDYYLSITVPKDFSKNLATLSGLDPKRAHVMVDLDDANGYIVGIMAKTIEAELQNQINTAVYVTFAKTMFGNLTELDEGMKKAATGAEELADGASSASQGAQRLASGLSELESGSEQVADGVGRINDAVQENQSTLIGSLDVIKAGAQAGTDITDALADVDEAELQELCESDGPLCDRLTEAVDRAKQDRDKVDSLNGKVQGLTVDEISSDARKMQELSDGANEVADGVTDAQKGAQDLADGTDELSKGADELADQLTTASDRIPSADPDQNAKAADVLGSPVGIEESNAHPAHTYGRGLAPFFFAIALWVFGLVAFLVLRSINPRALAGRVSALTAVLTGWLPALLLGLAGALVLYVVADVGLGLDPINVGGTIGLCLLTVAVFSAIAHLLRLAFDAAGGVAILVLLMLQLTSAGGLYPMETTPAFFQAVHPYLPMTYFVDAMRVTISGGNMEHLWRDVLVLTAFGAGAVIASTLVTMRYRRWSMRRLHPAISLLAWLSQILVGRCLHAETTGRGGNMTGDTRIPKAEITGVYGAVLKKMSKKMLGEVPEALEVMWNNKPVLKFSMGMNKASKWKECDRSLKSFAHMAAVGMVGCSFCLDLGYFQAHNEGLDLDKAREVPRWRESDVFTPLERDVLEYAEAMTVTPPTVTDELSARLLDQLGAPALVELTAFIALANQAARGNVAMGIEAQGLADSCDLKPLARPSRVASRL